MKAALTDPDISAFVPVGKEYEHLVDYMAKQLEIIIMSRAKEALWGAPDAEF